MAEQAHNDIPRQDRRDGHYILAIGRASSGKTTFQNFLIRYLAVGTKEFSLKPLAIDGKPASDLLLTEWMQEWRDGIMSPANNVGQPKEYAFRVTPIGALADKPPISFGFFEVSGEDLESLLLVSENGGQKLPDLLEGFLHNATLNFVVVLICDGEKPGRDDKLFSDFIHYLETHLPKSISAKFKKSCPVIFLVSKPDAAVRIAEGMRRKIKNQNMSTKKITPLDIVELFLPLSYNRIRAWGKSPIIAMLYIGHIQPEKTVGDKVVPETLIEPDFNHISQIFRWIYTHMSGVSPEPRLRQKIRDYFVRLFL